MTDYVKATREAAIKHGLDPNIFQRQIKQESNFDPKANSGSALGIAQFTPETAKGLGINPQDPIQSLNGAAGLMARYVKQYGNYEDALTAYNAGPGRVGKPLYAETQHYIKTILGSSGSSAAGRTKLVTQRAATAGPTTTTTVTPGTMPTTTDTVDTAGYQDAQKKVLLARLLQKQGQTSANNALFATGVLDPSATPQIADYTTQTTTPGTVASSVVRTTGTPQLKAGPGARAGSVGDKLAAVIGRASTLDNRRLPYKYGGGHGAGRVDPKTTGPIDCSAAVSAVLGIDTRVSGELAKWGKPGRGKDITVYANGGHTLVEINGHFFGTSASNPKGGAGWIPRSQISADYLKGFTARHPAGQ